ncbi:hydroxyacid dehydrogenase, partial [Rhodobacteraceae bacterium PD-2]
MSKTILVTGPDLDPSAAQLVADHGYETVHTPAYADSAVISEFLQKTRAEGIVSRMGRLDAGVMDTAPQL